VSNRPEERALPVRSDDGVDLAARFAAPATPRGAVVALHPHPLFGGTMESKVVTAVTHCFGDADFASIRFDFRGAGGSGGTHDHGEGEKLDALAAADALDRAAAGLPADAPRVLAGYSFGSMVGLQVAAEQPRFTHRVAIAPPIGVDLPTGPDYDLSFLLVDDPRPLWILSGEHDEYCPPLLLRDLVVRLRVQGVPTRAVLLPGADHFFEHAGHVLRQELARIAASIAGDPDPARRHRVIDL
jgi:uncharacterized protein